MKKVAVIIAAYNADKYIIECINSVKSQIVPDNFLIDINNRMKNVLKER